MNQIKSSLATVDFADPQYPSLREHSESFPSRLHRHGEEVNIPTGLVVSPDDNIRAALAEKLLLIGIAPTLATNLAESRDHVVGGGLSVVLCEDLLPDGRYSEILRLKQRARNNAPVIVVSRTGDWQEYFAAIALGAYDFLGYPPIPGELQRVIRHCLAECNHQQHSLAAST